MLATIFSLEKILKGLGEYPQQAGASATSVASNETVERNRKPNRKEPKQISFRVSELEYSKLQQSAETLNMTVPAFVKKKAQGPDWSHPNWIKKHDNR